MRNEGMTLRGTAHAPAASGRGPAVVLLHGFAGQRMESGYMFVQLGEALARRGVTAFAFDFRHCGESDGAFSDGLPSAHLSDALAILGWAQGRPEVDRARIGLLGFSLGGLLAACALARSAVPSAAALLAPTTIANLSRYAGGAGAVVGPLQLHTRYFDDLAALDPLSDLASRPRRTLWVQGTGDNTVAPSVSEQFLHALDGTGAAVTAHRIEGADHAFRSPAWRDQLQGVVGDFFAEAL